MFASVDALMIQVKAVCATEECIALTVSGSKFNADGRMKYGKGQLVDAERALLFKNLKHNVVQIQQTLLLQADTETAGLRNRDMKALQACAAKTNGRLYPGGGRLMNVTISTCDQVYNAALAICALYVIVSPIVAAICAAAATYGYINCKDAPPVLGPPAN
jgi:hypothetical protein